MGGEAMTPHTSRTLYFVLVGWCLVGSTIRIVWFVQSGREPDALPLITIVLALVALAHAFRPAPRRRAVPHEDG